MAKCYYKLYDLQLVGIDYETYTSWKLNGNIDNNHLYIVTVYNDNNYISNIDLYIGDTKLNIDTDFSVEIEEIEKRISEEVSKLQEKALVETDTLIIDGMSVPDELLNNEPGSVEEWNGEFEGWTFNGELIPDDGPPSPTPPDDGDDGGDTPSKINNASCTIIYYGENYSDDNYSLLNNKVQQNLEAELINSKYYIDIDSIELLKYDLYNQNYETIKGLIDNKYIENGSTIKVYYKRLRKDISYRIRYCYSDLSNNSIQIPGSSITNYSVPNVRISDEAQYVTNIKMSDINIPTFDGYNYNNRFKLKRQNTITDIDITDSSIHIHNGDEIYVMYNSQSARIQYNIDYKDENLNNIENVTTSQRTIGAQLDTSSNYIAELNDNNIIIPNIFNYNHMSIKLLKYGENTPVDVSLPFNISHNDTIYLIYKKSKYSQLLGDYDLDGFITDDDVTLYGDYFKFAGEGDYNSAYDLDGDKSINGMDLAILKRYTYGYIVCHLIPDIFNDDYINNLIGTREFNIYTQNESVSDTITVTEESILPTTNEAYADYIIDSAIISTPDGIHNVIDLNTIAGSTINKQSRITLVYTKSGSEIPDEPSQNCVASSITTDNDSITFSAKGTGTIKALTETTALTQTLSDVDAVSMTIAVPFGSSLSIEVEGEISELDLSNNDITNIEFNDNNKLERLKIHNNKLSNLTISPLSNLRYLHIYGNPIIDDYLEDENNYTQVKNLMEQLPDRTDKSLGSIILYPWYGLETLIYKADGNHYKTPAADFTEEPNDSTEKVTAGTLCKYPRRLRFVSPADKVAYTTIQAPYGESVREIGSEYYTDEPITEVFYNSDDKEDPHRSHLYVRNGIEYESEQSDSSILYAIVENYNIDSATKNSDKSNWSLKYVTYDTSGKETEHVLTKYNKLRKKLEQDSTVNKNWFFGSAIQDTDNFKYCQHYFVEAGVQDIWETTQKGFGLTWGIMDCVSSCQPDWERKNVVRYTNFCGNTLNAKIGTDLGAPTITDPRHTQGVVRQYNVYDHEKVIWGSNWAWGHGDHIISYLTSTGQQKLVYDDISCEDYLYGTAPNASIYVLDYISSRYTTANKFTTDRNYMYIDCESFDGIEASRDNMWFIYRINTGTNQYTTLKTIVSKDDNGEYIFDANGNYTYELVESTNVTINPEDEINLYALSFDKRGHIYSEYDKYKDVSFKDMFEHCDASSLSWAMTGVSEYFKYLSGRFGERRLFMQSAGNDGDNNPASTDSNNGQRSPSAPYKDYDKLNQSPPTYHSTAFIVGASTKALGPAEFSNDAADVKKYNFAYSDYMTSFGYGIKGYDNTRGILSFINGTSMSSPNACGAIILMMNLYKVINPEYSDEPAYNGEGSLSSDLLYDQNHLLSGGYGKFSPFIDYVKTHWMTRPTNSMVHQTGLGLPSFKSEPFHTIEVSDYNNAIPGEMDIVAGNKYPITNAYEGQKFTLSCNLKDTTSSSPGTLHVCSNVALANSNKLIGLRPGTHTVYLCDNNPAYGDNVSHLESDNNWERPSGFDVYLNTYNYYEMTLNINANSALKPVTESKIDVIEDDRHYLTLPEDKSKKFTVQFKIKFNNDSLYDNEEPKVGAGFISYIILYVGRSNLRYVHRPTNAVEGYVENDVLSPGNGANLQYLCQIENSDKDINGYSLKIPNIFRSNEYNDLYANTHTTNQSFFISDKSDITKNEAHVITAVSDGLNIYIYLDGTLIITDDSANAISSLNDVAVVGKLLSPTSNEELLTNLDKNILAYNRCLSEEEIFENVAYLLSAQEES